MSGRTLKHRSEKKGPAIQHYGDAVKEALQASTGPSQEPRSKRQAYYQNQKLKSETFGLQKGIDWISQMQRTYIEQAQLLPYQQYIHQCLGAGTGIVVTFPLLLEEMVENCSSSRVIQGRSSPVLIDETFNVCPPAKLYLTRVSFENKRYLNMETGKPPTMIAAFLAHERDDSATLASLLSRLCAMCPDLGNVVSVLTDKGAGLTKAKEVVFRQSFHLLCFLHARRDFEAKAKAISLSDLQAKKEAETVFGSSYSDLFLPL